MSLALGFLNGNKWDWSGDHERPGLISQSHNDIYLPSIGQRRLSWPDSVSVLVNSSTHGSVSVSAHIKILINKIQELELRLNWKLTLSTRSQSSTKLPRTRLNIFIYVFLSLRSLLQFLNWNNKSFNGETKKFPNKICAERRVLTGPDIRIFLSTVCTGCGLVLVQLLLYELASNKSDND